MERKDIENHFLDLIEGTLPTDEAEELLRAIERDPALKRSYEAYRGLVLAEDHLRSTPARAPGNFVDVVMDRLESEPPPARSTVMQAVPSNNRKMWLAFASTCCTLVFGVMLVTRNNEWKEPPPSKAPEQMPQSSNTSETAASLPPANAPEAKLEFEKPSSAPETALIQIKPSVPEMSSAPDGRKETASNPRLLANRVGAPEKSSPRNAGTSQTADVTYEDFYDSNAGAASKKHLDGSVVMNGKQYEVRDGKFRERTSVGVAGAPNGGVSGSKPSDEAQRRTLPPQEEKSQPVLSDTSRNDSGIAEMKVQGFVPEGTYYRPSHEQVTEIRPGRWQSYNDRAVAPSELSGERYNTTTANPRTLVREQPVSTFSIDVDTGSYTNARRYLQSGSLPPPQSVRLEEFLNYFPYSYPVQYDKPFTVSYEIAPSPFNEGRHLVKLGVKTRDMKEATKPWNLVFLVDVSGSMSPTNRLPLVKQALKVLVDKMRSEDRVSIVTYAGSSGVALESSSIADKSKVLAAIERLGAGGGTNGEGGIRAAYDVAQRSFIPGGVNRVVLATDGDFNVGVSDHAELVKLIEEKRKSNVSLTTIGVGEGNFNEGMMEQLANKGNGNFFYLDSFKEARKIFEDDLLGTIETVAKDVKIQVEFNPSTVIEYRLLGYENRALAERDFDNDAVDAGEIGSGHTVTALYEVVLKDSPIAGSVGGHRRYAAEEPAPKPAPEVKTDEIGFVKIRYKAPDGDRSELATFPIARNNVLDSNERATDDFRFAAAVAGFAELLSKGQYAGTASFDGVVNLAEKAKGDDKNGLRREFIELVKNARAAAR